MHHPQRWIAFLRMAVGVWFLKSLFTKLSWTALGLLPVATPRWVGFLPGRMQEYAVANPLPWYRDFLLEVAIPNAALFAHLTAFGEAAVGVGLTLGLSTLPSAAVGIVLMISYLLADAGAPLNAWGFNLVLIACMIVFIGARGGRVWGIDGWLIRRYRGSRAARVLL